MKRAIVLALMLFAVPALFTGVAHADLKSNDATEQAP